MTDNHMQWILTVSDLARFDRSVDRSQPVSDSRMTNEIAGVVQCQHVGLVRAGARIKVTERTDLRVRWPLHHDQQFIAGQRVIATIPVDAVHLEAGMFRRGKQRWNRWVGRIVLVEPGQAGPTYTVKIHGEDWTLKGHGPVLGAKEPPQTWDIVNVVVDPQKIDLSVIERKSEWV